MKIAVINEVSASARNGDIIRALEERGHEVFNVGMTDPASVPQLSYIHTGLLAGLLLYTKRVDFVVGGCGTGQGFLNAAMQYPGVFCGLVVDALDAWLFTQINGGNCISLPLNKGYGWAADTNLQFIFDRIFSVEPGCGYPEHRKEPQKASRILLQELSMISHRPMHEILRDLPEEITRPALTYPGILGILDPETLEDTRLAQVIRDITA